MNAVVSNIVLTPNQQRLFECLCQGQTRSHVEWKFGGPIDDADWDVVAGVLELDP